MLDPAADFEGFDGLTPLVFSQRREDGLTNETRVASALRHQLTIKEAAASFGKYTTNDVTWNLPVAELKYRPTVGDKLVEEEDGCRITWTILQVDKATLRTRWRLTCRDLVLHHQLRDALTLLKPTNVTAADGGREPSFAPSQIAVPARFQLVRGEAVDRHGKRAHREEFRVYCGERVYATPQDRITDQRGYIYEFVSDEGMDLIDTLQTITAQRVS